jgi:imidazolonepropionase-like amidohydrolase
MRQASSVKRQPTRCGSRITHHASRLLALSIIACFPAAAQQDPFREEIVAVRARRIETASRGVIENGVILLRNGRISAVGTAVKIPVGAKVIEAHTVMPGIVAAYSQIGLSSPGAGTAVQLPANLPPQIAARLAGAGGGRASSNTHYRVLDELYPFDDAYARLPRAGVTTLALVPEGRGFTGQGAVVRPVGETPAQMALAEASPFAIHFQQDTPTQELIRVTLQSGAGTLPTGGGPGGRTGFGGRGPGGNAPGDDETEQTEDADAFQRRQLGQGTRPGGVTAGAPSSLSLTARRTAVTRAVSGEVPSFIECADATSTVYALNLFAPFDRLKAVYVLPLEAYRVAEQLGQKKASVIIPADTTFEPNTRNRVNPAAILARAGVKVACRPTSDTPRGYEGLLSKMAELVKAGLDRDTALKAVTLHPAEMLGVNARVGSIETGRDGNLLLLDGDPFAPTTKVLRVLIDGKQVYDGS